MKRIIICTSSVLLIFLCGFAADTTVTERSWKVSSFVGRAEFQGVNGFWRPVRLNQMLRNGMLVRTYVESNVQLITEEGSVLSVDENAMMRLGMLTQRKGVEMGEVEIRVGKLYANIKKLSARRNHYNFVTPVATATIRGTELEIDVGRDSTRVRVFEGQVYVQMHESRQVQELKENQMVVVRRGQKTAEIEKFSDKRPDIAKPATPDTAKTRELPKDTLKTAPSDTSDSLKGPQGGELELDNLPEFVETAELVLSGKTLPGGQVQVNGKEVSVGARGEFKQVIRLSAGPNRIEVKIRVNGQVFNKTLITEYRPQLRLEVANITDGAAFTSAILEVNVRVTEGARFSINGQPDGERKILLKPGKNEVRIKAWDTWGRNEEKLFTVTLGEQKEFFLNVVTPANGALASTRILVSGSTLPEAKVEVQGSEITPSAAGAFQYVLCIPDEEGEYTVEIKAKWQEKEKTEKRQVTYKKERIPLSLTLTSPAEGMKIIAPAISVSGLARGALEVEANGHPMILDAAGNFTGNVQVSEGDVGEYALILAASNDREEITKEISLTVDATSPQINRSVPRISFTKGLQKATRSTSMQILAIDNTPEERMVMQTELNGEKSEVEAFSGSNLDFPLEPGKTRYRIFARDQAGNISNILSGEVTSIPRPPRIILVEPDNESFRVAGIPPGPRNAGRPALPVEVEIDDGIGDEPENITYVKATSLSGTVILRCSHDYLYQGQVEISRGSNRIEITAEDIAGNVSTKILNVLWQE